MFARMLDPVCPATGTEPWCSAVRPHCPQNTGGAATAMAPPASATQRHAAILFLGSVLMIPSMCLQILAAPAALPGSGRTIGRRRIALQETRVLIALDTLPEAC